MDSRHELASRSHLWLYPGGVNEQRIEFGTRARNCWCAALDVAPAHQHADRFDFAFVTRISFDTRINIPATLSESHEGAGVLHR